eukprot:15332529-Ditylum_brightwellii.AAC.1
MSWTLCTEKLHEKVSGDYTQNKKEICHRKIEVLYYLKDCLPDHDHVMVFQDPLENLRFVNT